MEAPKPIMTPENSENNFMNFNLTFNKNDYECIFYDINNEKIKIIIKSENNKYQNILSFNDFKNLNKYFRMFDSLKELENDLIGLYNSQKIEISNIFENSLNLCINVLTLENNQVFIQLKKVELNDKEKINRILEENSEIKKELKIKDSKINELEKEIQDLKNAFIKFQNSVEERFKIINSKENVNNDLNFK